jgi:hypothetical protein
LSASRSVAGTCAASVSEVTDCNNPNSFARCNRPASAVMNKSAGEFAPSDLSRSINWSADACTTLTLIPVAAVKSA